MTEYLKAALHFGDSSVTMMFCSQVVCVTLLLAVAGASEVVNVASEVANVTSEMENMTSEASTTTSDDLKDTFDPKDYLDYGKRTYEGYKLFRVTPESEEHLKVLTFIEKSVDSMWTPIPDELEAERQTHVDMMVNPIQSAYLGAFLECSSIPFEVKFFSAIQQAAIASLIVVHRADITLLFHVPYQINPLS